MQRERSGATYLVCVIGILRRRDLKGISATLPHVSSMKRWHAVSAAATWQGKKLCQSRAVAGIMTDKQNMHPRTFARPRYSSRNHRQGKIGERGVDAIGVDRKGVKEEGVGSQQESGRERVQH